MCEVFTSILARNQGGMRDFLQAGLRGSAACEWRQRFRVLRTRGNVKL